MTATFQAAVPLLRVADVGCSMAWYQQMLGFSADPFPDSPPFLFSILSSGPTEL